MFWDKGRTNTPLYSSTLLVWTMLWLSRIPPGDGAASYENMTKLIKEKLGSDSNYQTTVRPLLDQSRIMDVYVGFHLMAIVEIDAKEQKFVVNGIVSLNWTDEIVRWTPADYNGIHFIHPEPKQVWRPRLVLVNTVDKRDLFEDDYCPATLAHDGNICWNPGSLFPTSCKLNLFKYPFDEQECKIELYSMYWNRDELVFVSDNATVDTDYYTKSGEWELVETSIEGLRDVRQSFFRINFKLKRLPGFFVVNIITPIVMMSFLNILVFIIPVDSGEKISYGITVLLALTVFMSIVSEQLPKSSDTLPLVTIYLLVLTVISVLTVVMAIIIVYFHHRGEEEVNHQKAVSGFKSLFNKFNIMNKAGKKFSQVQVKPAPLESQVLNNQTTEVDRNLIRINTKVGRQDSIYNVLTDMNENFTNSSEQTDVGEKGGGGGGGEGEGEYVNRWRQWGQHLDSISFVVFTLIWFSVTLSFLVVVSN